MRVIDPNLDGITHINVYSGSRTELGRMLSISVWKRYIQKMGGLCQLRHIGFG